MKTKNEQTGVAPGIFDIGMEKQYPSFKLEAAIGGGGGNKRGERSKLMVWTRERERDRDVKEEKHFGGARRLIHWDSDER